MVEVASLIREYLIRDEWEPRNAVEPHLCIRIKLTPLRLLLELSGRVHVKLELPENGPG